MIDQQVRLMEEPSFGLWSRHGDPLLMDIPHRHNELELNLLERGAIHYLFPGQRVEIQAGQLFLFWAGVPHQLVWKSADTYIHWMTFPLAWLLRWGLSDELIQPLLRGQPAINTDTAMPGVDLAAFYRWHADLAADTEARRGVLLLELEARMRRLDLACAAPGAVSGNGKRVLPAGLPGKAERLAQYLSEHFTGEWSPEEAAQDVRLHPNYAMSLFQRSFGVSMGTYVTQLRVAMAQKLLLTSSMEILEIAFECGFSSASRFYDAFKSISGTTPHQYRKSVLWP